MNPILLATFLENKCTGVLIVEAMAQASGILGFKTMNKKPEDGSIYYFVGADNLRFKRPAVPGDQLVLSSKVITNKKESGSLIVKRL